jgi:serine/threonine protein kinase
VYYKGGGGYNYKADIYSYAMIAYEVLTKQEPYRGDIFDLSSLFVDFLLNIFFLV